MTTLSVNLNKVCLVRNSRGGRPTSGISDDSGRRLVERAGEAARRLWRAEGRG